MFCKFCHCTILCSKHPDNKSLTLPFPHILHCLKSLVKGTVQAAGCNRFYGHIRSSRSSTLSTCWPGASCGSQLGWGKLARLNALEALQPVLAHGARLVLVVFKPCVCRQLTQQSVRLHTADAQFYRHPIFTLRTITQFQLSYYAEMSGEISKDPFFGLWRLRLTLPMYVNKVRSQRVPSKGQGWDQEVV